MSTHATYRQQLLIPLLAALGFDGLVGVLAFLVKLGQFEQQLLCQYVTTDTVRLAR